MFSREKQIIDAEKVLIRQAKQLAKNQDPEYKLRYPSEAREASQGNYALLTKRIKQELKDQVEKTMKYRETHWK